MVGALGMTVLLALTLGLSGLTQSPQRSAHRAPMPGARESGQLPVLVRAPVSAALGRADPAYRVRALRATNPAQAFSVRFTPVGVAISAAGGRLSLRPADFGRGRTLRTLALGTARSSGNRVTYARGGLSAWYLNGPLGLEQGFVVPTRPGGQGAVTVALRIAGTLRARLERGAVVFVDRSGHAVLRYDGLAARDARGKALPASLSVSGGRVLVRVDDARAAYPLRIDPFIQQQELTAATGTESGNAVFGYSTALSANGNTALVGGPFDDGMVGAAWVFTRSGSTWTQQQKLTAVTGSETGNGQFGWDVSLSSDGNTALIGGPADNGSVGGAWVFTRSGSTWSQQQHLTADTMTETGDGYFGQSVALSPDGSTALIGGPVDNGNAGAAWLFTRSGSSWSQQQKLTVTDTTLGDFGTSVALSGDGSTAVVGASGNDSGTGAAWAFTRSGSIWNQQQELTPVGMFSDTDFGSSAAISADGNTAVIGGPNEDPGFALVFTRSGSSWSQQQLLQAASGTETGDGQFGTSAALSSDGNTALIGGPLDASGVGAAWTFTRAGSTWTQQQTVSAASGTESGTGDFGHSVALSADAGTALVGGQSDSGGVGAAWAFSAPSVTPPPKPACELRPQGKRVFAATVAGAGKKHKNKRPKGVLTLTASCNQSASLTLAGAITAVVKRRKVGSAKASGRQRAKTRTFNLTPVHASIGAGKTITIVVKLPQAALAALKHGARESILFTLTATNANGTSASTAKIKRLKLVKVKPRKR